MSQFKKAPISVLKTGAVLKSPIYDPADSQKKLLGAGVAITPDLLLRLEARRVSEVVLDGSDLAKLSAFQPQGTAKEAPLNHDYVQALLETEESEELDRRIDAGEVGEVAPEEPFANSFERPKGPFDAELQTELASQNETHVSDVTNVVEELVKSNSADPLELSDVCRDSLAAAAADLDLFASLGVCPFGTEYPFRHSTHVATLAIAVAATMGHGRQALEELALGCLVHDIGMLRLPKRLYSSAKRLGTPEIAEIANHPVLTAEMLGPHFDSLPPAVVAVAYQTHERSNRTGYPRQRGGEQIHPLAKIAAIADAFVALAAARPHREGLQPYFAIRKLLDGVKQGEFDPQVMRGLLRTVSLFPVGSFVKLSNGEAGRVIRANEDAYDRPIVQLRTATGSSRAGTVDLVQETELKVVQTLPSIA